MTDYGGFLADRHTRPTNLGHTLVRRVHFVAHADAATLTTAQTYAQSTTVKTRHHDPPTRGRGP
ncbi:MAG: hypothetical protein M3228_09580 [Actinomycetota bacterium]|nr:hypothetical protein [Actinomycetota bacterium]